MSSRSVEEVTHKVLIYNRVHKCYYVHYCQYGKKIKLKYLQNQAVEHFGTEYNQHHRV